MTAIPALKPREVMAILAATGFRAVRQRGSHKRFRHPDGRRTTVPQHGSRDISPFVPHRIARACGRPVEEFVRLRR